MDTDVRRVYLMALGSSWKLSKEIIKDTYFVFFNHPLKEYVSEPAILRRKIE